MTKSTQRAPGAQRGNKNSVKHGNYSRERAVKQRGLDAISLRTTEGQIAFAAAEAIVFDISPGGVFPTADGTTTLPALPAEPRRARLARLLEPLPEGMRLAITTLVGIIGDIEDIEAWKEKQRAKTGTIVNQRSKSLPAVVQQEYKSIEAMNKQLDKIYDGPIWKRKPLTETLEEILSE